MEESLLNLIEDTYETAANPSRWPDLMSQFRKEFKSPCVGVFTQNIATHEFNPIFVTGISDYYLDSYSQHYSQLNPWYELNLTKPGMLVNDQTVNQVRGDDNAFYNTEFFCDWMRPLGYRHSMGMALVSEGDKLINLYFQREKLSGHYTENEQSNFKKLSHALTHAIQISKRLQHADLRSFSSECLLDQFDTGVFMLSKNMEIIYCNSHAEEFLLEEEALSVVDNKLVCVTENRNLFLNWVQEIQLRKKISTQSFKLEGKKLGHTSIISAFPINGKTEIFSLLKPSVILMVSRPKPDKLCRYKLRELYNLTSKEIDITMCLYNGHSLRKAAELLEMSYATARWHLKTIFQKTDVHRQAELIKIVMSEEQCP